jgi:hypothetical protein
MKRWKKPVVWDIMLEMDKDEWYRRRKEAESLGEKMEAS